MVPAFLVGGFSSVLSLWSYSENFILSWELGVLYLLDATKIHPWWSVTPCSPVWCLPISGCEYMIKVFFITTVQSQLCVWPSP